ncbi:lasso RiPP family leader peptide-containing protein, partial [Longimicrobium sp.]
MQKDLRPAPRRPYVSPRLNVYGDVRDLTLSSRT